MANILTWLGDWHKLWERNQLFAGKQTISTEQTVLVDDTAGELY